jgi:threonine aldolase
MADAEVGDEQMRTDPTVNRLEQHIAELLGTHTSVFVPTATMANHIALQVHGSPGDEVIAEETSHVVIAGSGGAARHAGLMVRGLRGLDGRLAPDQVIGARRSSAGHAAQLPSASDPCA